MKLVYIAHPLGAGPDRKANLQRAARWCAWAAVKRGVAPSASWIVLAGVLPETPENRALGLECDFAAVKRCDEVWLVGGRVSEGMALEAEVAQRNGITIVDLTHLGAEPPLVVGAA